VKILQDQQTNHSRVSVLWRGEARNGQDLWFGEVSATRNFYKIKAKNKITNKCQNALDLQRKAKSLQFVGKDA
jgi:hypothetical protein